MINANRQDVSIYLPPLPGWDLGVEKQTQIAELHNFCNRGGHPYSDRSIYSRVLPMISKISFHTTQNPETLYLQASRKHIVEDSIAAGG